MDFQRAVVTGPEGMPVRSAAATALLTALLRGGPRPRAELSRMLGMSQAVVTRTVRPLLDAGYLVELPDQRAGTAVGRPLSPLQVVAERQYFVGIKATATELIGLAPNKPVLREVNADMERRDRCKTLAISRRGTWTIGRDLETVLQQMFGIR